MPPFSADLKPQTWFLPVSHRVDIRNLLLIALVFALLALLLTPARAYPISDECFYVTGLQKLITNGTYTQPDIASPTLVGMIWWGWLWSLAFGSSLTALSILILIVSLFALLGFYLLLRSLDIPPAGALLGVALLGFNPLYFHLSSVYMTEVPFLALVFYSCLCYLRGIRRGMDGWLWLGSFLAGYAFLIRQFGILIPVAVLLYLLFDRRWRWRTALAVALPTASLAIAYLVWQVSQPENFVSRLQPGSTAFLFTPAWVVVFVTRVLGSLPLLGLATWPLLRIRRRSLLLGWAAIGAVALLASIYQSNNGLPRILPNIFDAPGNILTRRGFDFFVYYSPISMSDGFWDALFIFGLALGLLLFARLSDGLTDALLTWLPPHSKKRKAQEPESANSATSSVTLPRRQRLPPITFIYLFGLLTALVTFAFTGVIFDRYLLAFIPMLIIFALRGCPSWGRLAWSYVIAGTIFLAVASVLLQADYNDHATARWQVGQALLTAEVMPTAVSLGFEWEVWYKAPYQASNRYIVTEQSPSGYRLLRSYPYYSRLGGFTNRYVGVWVRDDVSPPPLRLTNDRAASPINQQGAHQCALL